MSVWIERVFNAASEGDSTLLEQLLKCQKDPDTNNSSGETALMAACEAGNPDCVRLLLQAGADVNAADSEGCTPLIKSCVESDNSAVISELLNWNANINWRDQLGRTALICASIGHVDNVLAILRGSPDLNVVTQNYETALSFAVVWGRMEIIRCLLEAGADPYWRDPRGWTILEYAEASRDSAVIAVVRSYLDPSRLNGTGEDGPRE